MFHGGKERKGLLLKKVGPQSRKRRGKARSRGKRCLLLEEERGGFRGFQGEEKC